VVGHEVMPPSSSRLHHPENEQNILEPHATCLLLHQLLASCFLFVVQTHLLGLGPEVTTASLPCREQTAFLGGPKKGQ